VTIVRFKAQRFPDSLIAVTQGNFALNFQWITSLCYASCSLRGELPPPPPPPADLAETREIWINGCERHRLGAMESCSWQ
jgi:hypothetical protein